MPIKVPITVEDPNDIRNAGMYDTGAIIRLQTGATETGAFADVSGTGSTPTTPVAADTRYYLGFDPNGISSSWYRVRYENAGATRLSDWSAAFQVGDETAGLLCSLEDVTQRLFGTATVNQSEKELLLDIIREVSSDIEGACGRWFAPRPTNPASTTTYRMHTTYGRRLRVSKGIRTITTLSIAAIDQPDGGGTYIAVASGDFAIDPPFIERDRDWPGTAIILRYGGASLFYDAHFGAEIVGSFGFAAVPPVIQGVAIRAVTRNYLGKETAVANVNGILLRGVSPEDGAKLERFALMPVA